MPKNKNKYLTRFALGNLDLYSAILFLVGIIIVSMQNKIGWALIILAFLKQLSGR